MHSLDDLRHGFRILARSPGFAILVIVILALGIGLATAVFSVVNGVLLRPLGFHEPDRIVAIETRWPARGQQTARVTGGDYVDLRSAASTLEAISTWSGGEVGVQFADHAEFTGVFWVNRAYFDVLALKPTFGRLFDDKEAGHAAVVSLPFARRHFGEPASAVGRTVRIENKVYEIAGVLPDHVPYPRKADVWAAATRDPENLNRTAFNYRAIGRLKPGVPLAAAEAELQTIGRRLEAAYPTENEGKTFTPVPLMEQLVKPVRSTLLLLGGAVLLVLLIACGNAANLLLARAASRTREFGVRMAMGAGRGRLVRQLFAESLVLAALAAALGAMLAWWVTGVLVRFAPRDLPRMGDVAVDAHVLAMACGIAFASSLVFGLLPAWQASRVDVHDTLKQSSGKGLLGGGSQRLRSGVLVAEVGLSFVLAIGAGLLFRSFLNMMSSELGYRPEGLLVMYAHKPAETLDEYLAAIRRMDQVYDELRRLPGVRAVAGAMGLPAGDYGSNGYYQVEGKHSPEQFQNLPAAGFRLASPGYFATLGVPLERGREFTQRDSYDGEFVAIVSQALVRQVFPGEDPIGRRVRCGLDSPKWMTIVGIVADVRQDSPAAAPAPELYMPLAQHPYHANEVQVILRTEGRPEGLIEGARKTVMALDSSIATRFETMESAVSETVAAPRLRSFLVGVFAAMALVLAMSGIYGLMNYVVAQRTSELGLRLALGASPAGVLRLVLGRALVLALLGLVGGIAVALVGRRLVSSLLYGLDAGDGVTWASAALVTLAVSALAAAAPALRAARIEPVSALRQE
jgi:putative ABC transport system permease protein